MTSRRRARRGDGARLREEIIGAASTLLAERGDQQAVSIRAIAEAVGVTPPSIYLHFSDKDELMVALCDERFAALDRSSSVAVTGVADPLERIRRRGEAYIRFGLENPEHYRVLFMETRGAAATPDQLARGAAFGHLVDDVAAAIAANEVEGRDPFVVALALWATVHGITSLMIAMPDFAWPPVEDLLGACGAGQWGPS